MKPDSANEGRARAPGDGVALQVLRASEERQAFLLKLSDALRPLGDALEIQAVASRILGERLQVDRAYYGEINEGRREFVVACDWHQPGAPSHARSYPLEDWSMPWLNNGQTWVMQDVDGDATLPDVQRAAYRGKNIRAAVVVPLIKGARLAATFVVNQNAPRAWSPGDVELVRETAKRTWAAVERARTEQDKERFAALANNSQDFVGIADAGMMPFYVNPAGLLLVGLDSIDQVRRTPVLEFFFPEDRAMIQDEFIPRVVREGTGQVEVRFRHFKTGVPIWMTYGVVALKDAAGRLTGLATVSRDITGNKRREANLTFLNEVSQDLTQPASINQLMDTLGGKIAAHLALSRCVFAEVREAENKIIVIRDWSRPGLASLVGEMPMSRFINEGYRQKSRAGETIVIPDVRQSPLVENREVEGVLKIASLVNVPLLRHGQWCFTLGVYDAVPREWRADEVELVRELTARVWNRLERARAEAALREREADLARVQHIGRVGGIDIVADIPGGLRSRRSPEYLRLHGLPPDMVDETHAQWRERVHPEDRVRAEQTLFTALEGTTPIYENEYRIVRPSDGGLRWMHVRADIERDATGKAVRVVGAHVDVTEQKLLEEALREADRRKSEFLAMLGHELRNPLAAVEGGVKLLQATQARPDLQAGTLPIVAQQVAHMKRLIDDVLDLARLERGKLQVQLADVDLAATLQASRQMTENLAQAKGSRFSQRPPPRPVRLRADAERLVQVFVNLFTNALKFSPPHSTIEVWSECGANTVAVHVRDHGRGITPEDLPQIFEPFVQSKLSLGLSEGGLGLGLSVSRELVELHHGTITAASAGPGQGSTFTVTLPLVSTA